MKTRKIHLLALIAGMAMALPACDLFETCGVCEMVTIEADGTEDRTSPLPFCGDDLEAKKSALPETVDGKTIYWECE